MPKRKGNTFRGRGGVGTKFRNEAGHRGARKRIEMVRLIAPTGILKRGQMQQVAQLIGVKERTVGEYLRIIKKELNEVCPFCRRPL